MSVNYTMKTRYPACGGGSRTSICETYLEVLAVLLVGAAVAVGLWALPMWVLVAIYTVVLAGGFVLTAYIERTERHHPARR